VENVELLFGVELSERELSSIGRIIALWGALEYEIFCQTVVSFDGATHRLELPKELQNNMRFSEVLALWEVHVVTKAIGTRKDVLQQQAKHIRDRQEFRNAIAHGMWDWSEIAPEKITTMRVHKDKIVRVHFTADDLESLASELETINSKIRWPDGFEDYAMAMAEQGSYVSRLGLCMMTSNPLTADLLPFLPPKSE
jgi:hypothetical protein